jgi:hypothetical protein
MGQGTPARKDLVRVVGVAYCDYDEVSTLIAQVDGKKLRMKIPSELGTYQLWVKPGTWITLELQCRPPRDQGECSFATSVPNPARFRVPVGPMSGVEGPSLEASGGLVCD